MLYHLDYQDQYNMLYLPNQLYRYFPSNLVLVIKQFDSSVVKRTPAIIKTHFLAGKVFVIAEQINAMKEYSKNFAAYANNIEASVEKFEQAVEFFKKNKIVL